MWKRLVRKFSTEQGRKGFTMAEMLAVIGIIAVLSAIIIISVITISRNLKFKQKNDYAKTIFMAAQANLTEMRSDGSLTQLQGADSNSVAITSSFRDRIGFPAEEWSDEYVYTGSELAVDALQADSYGLVLPVNSVESTIRDKKVIIEYNPITGNVYSVFYSEENESILSMYTNGTLPRDEDARKEIMLGYYDGSGLSSPDLELDKTAAEVEFINGEEGFVTVKISTPGIFYSNLSAFADGLDVKLTLTGETSGGRIVLNIMTASDEAKDLATYTWADDGKSLLVKYTLDSLTDYNSFANLAAGENADGVSLTTIANESKFTILPGENLTIKANATYSGSDVAVLIDPGILTGVNPLFDYLEPSINPGKYILSVSNGRNLQNLNVITPSIAAAVENVVFSDDIYWNETVDYYNDKYASGGTYTNSSAEAPGRALPYFVPIHNELLFGTSWFSAASLPVMQDNHDATVSGGVIVANDHADVVGNGHMVVGLNIDSTRYTIPNRGTANEGEYYVTAGYTAANGCATGGNQTVSYNFTGLFAYANTNISDLNIVNSFIKGLNFDGDADRTVATGGLLGAGGYNALISDCGVYIVTDPELVNGYFDYSAMNGPQAYSASAEQTWYGVSGEGSVGGLVGYTKSHRTASGDLTDDTSELAFSRCFAAVPVSGNMRGSTTRQYGYTNGVGGLVGTGVLSNFYNCYASGNVLATGSYAYAGNSGNNAGGNNSSNSSKWSSIIKYTGNYSMGIGGFVGTSHGSRYTNCFASGNVTGTGDSSGIGGFVGIMCYDEGFDYVVSNVTQRLEQLTVFDSCYAVGQTSINGTQTENFSGGNAGIYPSNYIGNSSYIYTDYYAMYAPYCIATYTKGATGLEGAGYPELYDTSTKPSGYGRNLYYYYVYKDCYYLDRSLTAETAVTSSTGCASAASYGHLMNLIWNHQADDPWISDQLTLIQAYKNTNNAEYLNAYFYYTSGGKQTYWQGLEDAYLTELAEGYPSAYWTSATAATTHSYSISGGTYLFSMLSGMDYYGDWPTYPLSGGLAYYEYYNGRNGIYARFDREDTGNLMSADELRNLSAHVVSDGYAVVAESNGLDIHVTVGGKIYTLSGSNTETWQYGSKTMTLYPLTQEILEEAAAQIPTEGFYVQLIIHISGDEYITYFNPNVANSQINPVMVSTTDHTNPDRPTSLPNQIQIRTARQLAALSTAPDYWADGYRYAQLLDIDAATYTAYGYENPNAILTGIANTGSIGNAEHPFLGSYSGLLGVRNQTSVSAYPTASAAGLGNFGVIGETGTVKNLTVSLNSPVTLDCGVLTYAGIVADINNGTVDNVDMVVNSPVTLIANTGAGLLVGHSTGTVANCDITAAQTATVTITAENAGGALGVSGGSIDNCTLTLNGAYQPTTTNAGGFTGSAVDADVRNVKIALNGDFLMTSSAGIANAGGFAGSVTGGSYSSVSVTVADGSAPDRVGGIAGTATGATFANAAVTVTGTISGNHAAGLLAYADSVSVNNSNVTNTGTVSGNAAAGIAVTATEESSFSSSHVVLRGGSVQSPDGIAAGYAVYFHGDCAGGQVKLDDGSVIAPQAAGFAHTISGKVTDYSAVAGTGSIVGNERAAGYVIQVSSKGLIAASRVTPAVDQSPSAYWQNTNENLIVNSATAAGFAMNVETGATIQNCDALCAIFGGDAASAGFADTNKGTIEGCIANVTMTGGYAFVRDNTLGIVKDCYGWFGDGFKTNTTSLPSASNYGTYYSSYFVDIDLPEEEGDSTYTSVVLFDTNGNCSMVVPSTLVSSLGKLNTGTTSVWFAPGNYPAFSYSISSGYPFPMLREHCGDWTEAHQNAFGVIYYEIYEDDTSKFHAVELSNPEETSDEAMFTFYSENASIQTGSCFNEAGTIVDAGYLLFCKTDSDPFGGSLLGARFTDAPSIENVINSVAGGSTYSVYELNATDKVEFISMGRTIEVLPFFADAIGVSDGYQIRTADQLASISRVEASFQQTHDITVSGRFNTIGSKTLSSNVSIGSGNIYDGNGFSITATNATNTWITAVNGTVRNLTLTVGSLKDALFKTVDTNGNITGLTLTLAGDLPSQGSIIGTTGGTVSIPAVTLNSACIEGKLIGSVTGGTVTLNQVTANSANTEVSTLFGNITGGKVTGTLIDLKDAVVHSNLFDSVTGGAELSGFTISAGSIEHSIIHVVTGTVSGLTVNVDTANLEADSGMLIDELTARTDADGHSIANIIRNCTVNANSVISAGKSFGIITGEAPDSTSITGCNATIGSISANGDSVGGLVGNNSGAISGSSVNTIINATDASVVGGLAGVNRGDISTSTAQITINYTQTRTPKANAVIGGLVGQMDGGSISGQQGVNTVSGAIRLVDEAAGVSKRNYIVGGAIGKDFSTVASDSIYGSRTSYTNISSTVTVDTAWAGSNDASETVTDPASVGPVGMFIGYVQCGNFSNCSSTAANSTYQFLGQIECTQVTLTGSNWFSHPSSKPDVVTQTMGASDTLDSIAAANGYTALSEGYAYQCYYASLNACTFNYGGSAYTQTFHTSESFFHGEKMESPGGYSKDSVSTLAPVSSVTYRTIYNGVTGNSIRETNYYTATSDGTLSRLYVKVTSAGQGNRTTYTYTLYTLNGSSYNQIAQWSGTNTNTQLSSGITLYAPGQASFATDAYYMITNSSGTVALTLDANTNTMTVRNIEDINSYSLWTVSNGIWRNVGNPNYYLNPSQTGLISSSGQQLTVTASGAEIFQISVRSGNRTYYISYSSSGFSTSTSTASELCVFQVTHTQSSNSAVFTYKQTAQLCVALDANDSVLPETNLNALQNESNT